MHHVGNSAGRELGIFDGRADFVLGLSEWFADGIHREHPVTFQESDEASEHPFSDIAQ